MSEAPLYFSGEMIFPFLFDIFPELEKLAIVADEIAKYSGWPELYDLFQLARNEVSDTFRHFFKLNLTDTGSSVCGHIHRRYVRRLWYCAADRQIGQELSPIYHQWDVSQRP